MKIKEKIDNAIKVLDYAERITLLKDDISKCFNVLNKNLCKKKDRWLYEFMIEDLNNKLSSLKNKYNFEQAKLSYYIDRKPSKVINQKVDIELLKESKSIVDVVRKYIFLKKSGDKFNGRCPFHKDRHPSLWVYEDTNSFYCFSCQFGGDAITFIKKIEVVEFNDAIEILKRI